MDKSYNFEQFLTLESPNLDLLTFSADLTLAFLLSFILGQVFIKFGSTISNRNSFAKNLILIAMTTMFVISIVKSSLALSLGLVGALSIVRFRTPIKEPEELAFLFVSIAIGLGLGANQRAITIIAIILIIAVLIIRKLKTNQSVSSNNLYVTINSLNGEKINLSKIMSILESNEIDADLRRLDEGKNQLEITFKVIIKNIESLQSLKKELRDLDSDIQFSFIDQQGVIE